MALMTCEGCGRAFRAKRRDARLCSARCRQRASRAGKAGHVTDNPGDGAAGPVTATPGPPPALPPRFWERPDRCPRCRWCGMAIEGGEPASGPYHAECARYVAARHQPEQSAHG